MQQIVPLNMGWLYKPSFTPADRLCQPLIADYQTVDLPHANRMLPANYLDEQDYQFISCYAKSFSLPPDLVGKDVFLDFEGVMLAANVYLNGQCVCRHKGGYTPFTVDLTRHVRTENWLVVEVDSTERPDIPPYGKTVDYLTYGGIYREVQLRIADRTRLEDVRLTARDCLLPLKGLEAEVEILAETACRAELCLSLEGRDGVIARAQETVELAAGRSQKILSLAGLKDIALWDLDHPTLYGVTTALTTPSVCDRKEVRFGFRDSRFTPEGYYLNGRRISLVGLNRHQSFPYVGYAMPARVQKRDAQILKEQAGVQLVRTSHYPQSRHFLDSCDELGLLVMEEIPGWQHIGDSSWQAVSLQEEEAMIRRDRNRPCIVLWGVRINESQDDHAFYTKTNALAHRLDPSRPTGGTRYIQRSEFLEDVYTYNDFTYNGSGPALRPQRESTGLDHDVPLLVTESMGHMYPVKSFDNESRRVEHALRHLRLMNASMGRMDLAGQVSWCAFDYQTHSCFGSGDKVCYHGVFDMFRNPKYAAYAYASQKKIEKGIVLEPITVSARGERDGVGIVPFYVMTNCDCIRVYKNGALIDDFYPDRGGYPHLAHPPVRVTHLLEKDLDFGFSQEDQLAFRTFVAERLKEGNLLYMRGPERAYLNDLAQRYGIPFPELFTTVMKSGGGWGDLESTLVLEGIHGGQSVIRRMIGERKSAGGLALIPDDRTLNAQGDTYDATRVVVRAVDTLGNPMPFSQDCVQVVIEGPARLLGPDRFALAGGASAFWVRTVSKAGTVRLTIQGVYSHAQCEIQVV